MEQRKEDMLRRPLYVYALPPDLLESLSESSTESEGIVQGDLSTSLEISEPEPQSKPEGGAGSKSCSMCGVTFPALEEQRSHIRSDFHGYNLKQKLRGVSPVSEADFEKLVDDLNESLSGSDPSDSDDDEGGTKKDTTLSALLKKQAAISSTSEEGNDTPKPRQSNGRPPLYWFKSSTLPENIYLGVYRAIFTNSQQGSDKFLETFKDKQIPAQTPLKTIPTASNGIPLPEAYKDPHMFLCMIGGGHFAAMVVSLVPKPARMALNGPISREATVIIHKGFHRYTTRRKQGGAQSSNDSAKGAAHSAGASIRRYNEIALTEEVRQLLSDWKDMIDTSELLFVRAVGNTNKRTLYGPYEGQVLKERDPRVRGFPFNTRRATQSELMRAFIELTRLKVHTVDPAAIEAAAAAAAAAAAKGSSTAVAKPAVAAPKRDEAEETALLHTSQIQALIRRSKLPALLAYLNANSLSANFKFTPWDTQANHHAPTPLHLAASQNSPPLVTGLLVKGHADPGIKSQDSKTAFELAGDRATRDAFRVARHELGEAAWAWNDAGVPAALSEAAATDRSAREKAEETKKEAERRRAEEQRLQHDGPRVESDSGLPLGRGAAKGRAAALGHALRKEVLTPQERRDHEGRGLTGDMKARLEREKRARAAEERMKRLAGGT